MIRPNRGLFFIADGVSSTRVLRKLFSSSKQPVLPLMSSTFQMTEIRYSTTAGGTGNNREKGARPTGYEVVFFPPHEASFVSLGLSRHCGTPKYRRIFICRTCVWFLSMSSNKTAHTHTHTHVHTSHTHLLPPPSSLPPFPPLFYGKLLGGGCTAFFRFSYIFLVYIAFCSSAI